MSEIEPSHHGVIVPRDGSDRIERAVGEVGLAVDWPDLVKLARRRRVVLVGVALIVAQLIWKAQFLTHFYFRQDDIHVFELAQQHPLSWKYLTFVGAGHLIPGVYAIAWVMVRVAVLNWGVATAVIVALLAIASFAALRLLVTLFGDRPAILIPLVFYLLTPLTLPDDGWWSSAVESIPLQAAIFLALTSHVHYVRTGRLRNLIGAAVWLTVGLIFFEKALVIPVLLFAVTAGFMVDAPLLTATRYAIVRYWRAWAIYVVLIATYLVILDISLRTSSVKPAAPSSLHAVLTFGADLVRLTLVPGIFGGPWQWFPSSDGTFAYSSPPDELAWLSLLVVVVLLVASVLTRRRSWRAWAIMLAWVVLADMLPVVIGRFQTADYAAIYGIETRYVADAAAVLAICIGLAFWPVLGGAAQYSRGLRRQRKELFGSPAWLAVAGGMVGAFVIGSLWSAQAYENDTSNAAGRTYLTNARAALAAVPAGTTVLNQQVPTTLMLGIFGKSADESEVIGLLEKGRPNKIRWISQPDGTYDKLMVFGTDGKLHQASIYGKLSLPRPPGQGCWPERHGEVQVAFNAVTLPGTNELRVGYIYYSKVVGSVTVTYGSLTTQMTVKPGLNAAFLPVSGRADSVIFSGFGGTRLCVGDAEAGVIVPAQLGPTIPAG